MDRRIPGVLKLDYLGLTEADMDTEFFTGGLAGSADERMKLALLLNGLLASPAFAAWLGAFLPGIPLDGSDGWWNTIAAADVDVEVLMQRVTGEAMGPAFGRVTIYTNAQDKALAAAEGLFKSRQRLGTLVDSELTER